MRIENESRIERCRHDITVLSTDSLLDIGPLWINLADVVRNLTSAISHLIESHSDASLTNEAAGRQPDGFNIRERGPGHPLSGCRGFAWTNTAVRIRSQSIVKPDRINPIKGVRRHGRLSSEVSQAR